MVSLGRGQSTFFSSQCECKCPCHNCCFYYKYYYMFISFLFKQEQTGGKNYPHLEVWTAFVMKEFKNGGIHC